MHKQSMFNKVLTLVVLFTIVLHNTSAQQTKQNLPNSSLHRAFPILNLTLAHIDLADLPTPVQAASALGSRWHIGQLYVKRDDLTGQKKGDGTRWFGGNKVRKLGFLLADALEQGKDQVLTFGCIGSNHVVATGCCAQRLGLNCTALLKPQPYAPVVERNALLMHHYGIEMVMQKEPDRARALNSFLAERHFNNEPYVIPVGGSNARGMLGFVDAAFELKEQIDDGLLPCPDCIYVPVGSCGTAAGLLLGAALAGLDSVIVPVAVFPEPELGWFRGRIIKLIEEATALLKDCGLACHYEIAPEDIVVRTAYTGKAYGETTEEGLNALQEMYNHEGILLDTTYSSKAMAALRDDAVHGLLQHKTVLFWDTFCSMVDDAAISAVDRQELPKAVQDYFASA